MIIQFFYRGEEEKESTIEENIAAGFPSTHAYIMYLFDSLMHPKEVFADHPEDNKLLDMFALSTHVDYRGKGIAGQLVKHAFQPCYHMCLGHGLVSLSQFPFASARKLRPGNEFSPARPIHY